MRAVTFDFKRFKNKDLGLTNFQLTKFKKDLFRYKQSIQVFLVFILTLFLSQLLNLFFLGGSDSSGSLPPLQPSSSVSDSPSGDESDYSAPTPAPSSAPVNTTTSSGPADSAANSKMKFQHYSGFLRGHGHLEK